MNENIAKGLGSAISALPGAAGMIGSALFNYWSQQNTNLQNRQNVEYQNQQNYAQWMRENAYNDPAAVMARLKRAGINPGILYEGGAGNLASAPSPEMQGARDVAPQMSGMPTMADFAALKATDAQADLYESQKELNLAEADLKRSQLPEAEQRIAESRARVNKLVSDINLNVSQISLNDALESRAYAEAASISVHDELAREEWAEKKKQMAADLKMTNAEFERFTKETLLVLRGLRLQNALINKQIRLTDAQFHSVNQEIKNAKLLYPQISAKLAAVGVTLNEDGTFSLVEGSPLRRYERNGFGYAFFEDFFSLFGALLGDVLRNVK